MKSNTIKRKYPYSKNRAYLSAAMVVLSLLLGAMGLQGYPALALNYILYSALSTAVFTIATFLLKTRIYPIITEGSTEEESQTKTYRVTWKILLLVLCMLIALISAPLILAAVLGGFVWFILMISFIMGVSLSEIIFYVNAR